MERYSQQRLCLLHAAAEPHNLSRIGKNLPYNRLFEQQHDIHPELPDRYKLLQYAECHQRIEPAQTAKLP